MARDFTPTNKDGAHHANILSWALERFGHLYFLAISAIRPTTVTIYNVPTNGAGWVTVAAGLADVLSWKLTEENGSAFRYCFDGVGATYMTSYGSLQRDTAITAIYAQRTGAVDITLQLEVWTP